MQHDIDRSTQRFPQSGSASECRFRASRVLFGHQTQCVKVLRLELWAEPCPPEQALVAVEPVPGRCISRGDGIDEVEGDIPGDQIRGSERMFLGNHFRALDMMVIARASGPFSVKCQTPYRYMEPHSSA